MRALSRLRGVALAAALVLVACPAAAQAEPDAATKSAARDLARQAREAFLAKEWERARDLYRRAYALVPAPTLAVREARTLVELGRLVEAEELYREVQRTPLDAASPGPFREAVQEAEQALVELGPRIARVRLVVSGARAEEVAVELDGKPVPPALVGVERPIDPGDHVVIVRAPGKEAVTRRFQLADGATSSVELDVAAAPSAPPDTEEPPTAGSGRRTLGIVLAGVGIVGVGVGIQQGLVAVDRQGNLADDCTDGRCPASSRDDLDAFRQARTLSTVGYVVGAVALGAGAYLYLSAPRSASSAAIRPWVSVGSVGVDGAF